MDAAGLRALQAPIKDRYKSDPEAALITLRAHGTLDDGNMIDTALPVRGPKPLRVGQRQAYRKPSRPCKSLAPPNARRLPPWGAARRTLRR